MNGRDMNSPTRGISTAIGSTVSYRIGLLERRRLIAGRWLDIGCAEGSYSEALVEAGASSVTGVDIDQERIADAMKRNRHFPRVQFEVSAAERLPFGEASFDAVFINEVLEHVADERATLREAHRVLCSGGLLILVGPNRWFPFEGHGIRLGRFLTLGVPVPFVPWLPTSLTRRFVRARNYWPRDLGEMAVAAGFVVEDVQSVFPLFARYPWMPRCLRPSYLLLVPRLETMWGVRRLGVSTLIVGRRV
jgi:SAM-dependent methyltransferase